MSNPKRDVSVAGGSGDKPVAPADLWAKMDAITAEYANPAGSFTAGDFCRRYNITEGVGQRRLAALVKKGAVTKVRRGVYALVAK